MSELDETREFAEILADAARNIVREATRKPFEIIEKSDGSPVTVVDRAVEDAIRGLIADKYPGHGVLGEEREDTAPDAHYKWIIDPIDGTLPFLAGIPVFGTLIALVRGVEPILGIIEMPMTGERWIGCEGMPTTVNGMAVRSRDCPDISQALMATSNPDFYAEDTRPSIERLRLASQWCVYGGSCMAYAQLASGRVDLAIDVGFDIHDYLALVPVIYGAGGMITDWQGENLTIHSGDRIVAAGNSGIHAQALELLG